MAEFYRVLDRETGHEYTTAVFLPGVHQLLNEPAVDADGRTLPAKPNPTPGPIAVEPEPDPAVDPDTENPPSDPPSDPPADSGAEGNQPTGRGRRGQSSQQTDQQSAQGGSTNTGGN